MTYDEKGNTLKQEEFNDDDTLVSSLERTFDEEGNLIESLAYIQSPEDDTRQMYATKYEYEYYEE